MSNIAIKVENLSKAYQLGQIGTGTISRDLERWYARMRGKEDPFLKIGETNDRSLKGNSDVVWSLKDINFEIEQGDAVGIIGRNGAGKSTLLKILSKITAPTTGKISGNGRIASLLEVGTGFHPELSGRENIFLNGAILGMRKKEIQRKLDEIVDFAGIERYLDTPVKRYSSGMYVRLAFAVAAHLESEILIVDEVLAVGDAEFQKKCLGKMKDVSTGEGRTVLFVSHNMGAINKLCNNLLLLEQGKIIFNGEINKGYDIYQNKIRSEFKTNFKTVHTPELGTLPAYISELKIKNEFSANLSTNETLSFEVSIKSNHLINDHRIGIKISNSDGAPVGLLFTEAIINLNSNEEVEVIIDITSHNLAKGIYMIDFSLGTGNEESPIKDIHIISEALIIEIAKKDVNSDSIIVNWNALNWGNNHFIESSITLISKKKY